MKTNTFALFLFAVLFISAKADFEDITSSIKGTSGNIGSYFGGNLLTINGDGFSSQAPEQNRVDWDGTYSTCTINSFQTTTQKISCWVPPNQPQFIGQDRTIQFAVTVDNKRSAGTSSYTYRYDYTPTIEAVIPSAANNGQKINWVGINRVSTQNDVNYFKIGDNKCGFSNYNYPEPITFWGGGSTALPCDVPSTNQAGYYQVSQQSNGYGNAWKFKTVSNFDPVTNTAYDFAIAPKISSISSSSGSPNGQILTVSGSGFNPSGNVVSLGDTACNIISESTTSITCELQPRAASPATTSGFHSGVKFEFYDNRWDLTQVKAGAYTPTWTSSLLSLSTLGVQRSRYAAKISGYFVAPTTSSYTFFTSGDDNVQFWLDSGSGLNKIAWTGTFSAFGFPWISDSNSQSFSSPVSLTAGQSYYFEAYHVNWGGDDRLHVGVRIAGLNTNGAAPVPEVQSIKITGTIRPQSVDVALTLGAAPAGTWRLKFNTAATATATKVYKYTSAIPANPTPADFQNALSALGITSVVTQDPATPTNFHIDFTTRTGSIFPPEFEAVSGLADCQVAISNYIARSTDFGGTWTVSKGSLSKTLNFDADAGTVADALRQVGYTPLIRVSRFNEPRDGAEWRVAFFGDQGDLTPIQASATGLTGSADATSLAVTVTEIQAGNLGDAWYEAIPINFLRTSHTNSQLTVKSNGIFANCPAFNCDYTISTAPVPTLSGASWSSGTLTVSVADAPAGTVSVQFANGVCTASISSGTVTASCTDVEMGDQVPRVHFDGYGFADNSGLTPITVTGTLTAVTSLSSGTVNPNGGSTLTLTGTGFPATLARAVGRVTVTVGGVAAKLSTVSTTQIVVKTGANPTDGTVSLAFNGQTLTNSALTILSTPPTITGTSPASLNPVLQTDITITGTDFDSANTYTSAKLVDSAGNEYPLYVKTPASTTTITATFLGAPSGTYNLVATTQKGNTNSWSIQVKIQVTGITPTAGSTAGGTILTISGGVFADVSQQSLVYIGPSDSYVLCDVVTTTSSQITCRTRAALPSYGTTPQAVLVATRIVEEATCQNPPCQFTYLDANTPHITGISKNGSPYGPNFLPGDVLTFSGSNLGSSATITIGSVSLTVTSNTGTEITATVPSNAATVNNAPILITCDNLGYAVFDTASQGTGSIALTVTGVTQNVGSTAGALVKIAGFGFSSATNVKVGTGACLIRSLSSTEIQCFTATSGAVSVNDASFTNVGSSFSVTFSGSPIISTSSLNGNTLSITGGTYNSPVVVNLVVSTDKSRYYPVSVSGSATLTGDVSGIPGGNYIVEVSSNGRIGTGSVTLPVTASASPITSSVGGGFPVAITGSGFSTDGTTQVTVCGLPAQITVNSPTSISATTPLFLNAGTRGSYANAVQPGKLAGSVTANSNNAAFSVDNAPTTFYSSSAAACFVQFDIGAGRLAEVTEFRYFPRVGSNPTNFAGTLIQGSNDASAWTTIYTFDANSNDGWNYFNPSTTQRYRYYRYSGTPTTGSCAFAELLWFGYALSDSTGDASSTAGASCDVVVTVNGNSATPVSGAVVYKNSVTPIVDSISPKFGTAAGGTTLTITGTGFQSGAGTATVYIDDTACTVTSASTTQVVCTTGVAPTIDARRNSLNSALTVSFAASGAAITNGITYLYIDRWSDPNTWGGIAPPRSGDSVWIPPGQNVLLDVSTPYLNAIVIQGALIFEDKDLTLDANYIIVRQGRLQIGTPENRFTKKATVTIHGNKLSKALPHFGNKVIALREGIIDFHGVEKAYTWSRLDSTVNIDATSMTLIDNVDWSVGDKIVITSTEHDHFQSEELTITGISVSSGKSVITFQPKLRYGHYAGSVSFGSSTITMRAEVGLLTRNVKIQGDDTSEANEYGVHIMSFSPGDDTSQCRISYTEVTQAGQAYNLGRYPIHHHLIGNVHSSYVIGNAIHHTYNRAVTIHGVHYLKVQKNVAYWVKGHTIFIEDGIETQNIIEDNLVINTRSSEALLNTDQTPACFWITNPNNIWRNNVCAGSERYGFWFDLREHPEGPSATDSICPTGVKLGVFDNNEAHSVGRYALRIFHEHIPRTNPCQPYADFSQADPWAANPPIQSVFSNFLGWKNRRDTVIGERLGAVKFSNILSADNLRAGIEISDGNFAPYGDLLVDGATIVGKTAENAGSADYSFNGGIRGLITPKVENFLAKGIHFFNFGAGHTAIETCSHCEHGAATDSGGRTSYLTGLSFTSVTQKVRFNIPYREILVDLDGSLTGTAGQSVTFAYPHLLPASSTGCTENQNEFNGVVCDPSVKLRRILFSNPQAVLEGMDLRVLRVDNPTDITTAPLSSYSQIGFRMKKNPMKHWVFVGAAGKTYKIHWANGLDWTTITMERGDTFTPTDPPMTLIHNHSEFREAFEIVRTNPTTNISNQTTLWDSTTQLSRTYGDWFHDVANTLLYVIFDGKAKGALNFKAFPCRWNCPSIISVPKESTVRLWSDVANWPNNQLPQDGDDVVIQPAWNMTLDVSTNNLKSLTIQGDLHFDITATTELKITAGQIWVQGGLYAGAYETFKGQARIVLTGNRRSPALILAQNLDASNKVLAVTGNLTLNGVAVPLVSSKLAATADATATQITLTDTVEGVWAVGDDILIVASNNDNMESEKRTITAIAGAVVTLDTALEFRHFGDAAATATAGTYGTLDTRTEVLHLTRNIHIEGTTDDNWGGRVYVAQIDDASTTPATIWRGFTYLQGVSFWNMGQPNTTYAALAFDQLTSTGSPSIVSKCVIRESPGWALSVWNSNYINIDGNVFWKHFKTGVDMEGQLSNIQFTHNFIIENRGRDLSLVKGAKFVDFTSNFKSDKATFSSSDLANNVAADCAWHCWTTAGHDCNTATVGAFHNNFAHTGQCGWLIYSSPSNCLGVSHFTGYNFWEDGIASYFPTKFIKAHDIVLADARMGVELFSGGAHEGATIWFTDSWIAAYVRPASYYTSSSQCSGRFGILTAMGGEIAKTIPPSKSSLPWRNPHGGPVFQSSFYITNVEFVNFADTGVCKNNFGIATNDMASDTNAISFVKQIKWTTSSADNIVFFWPNDIGSIGIDNCGGWPCTGWSNTIIKDLDGSLTAPLYTAPTVSAIYGNIPSVGTVSGCRAYDTSRFKQSTGSYICAGSDWGMLVWESEDGDRMTRIISPVNVTRPDGWRNDINTQEDHGWDGFYTSLKRLSRFWSVIQTNKAYTIFYTGTIPTALSFQLQGVTANDKLTLTQKYTRPNIITVKLNGNAVKPNIPRNGVTIAASDPCGANVYSPLDQTIEWRQTGEANCIVTTEMTNGVMGKVRYQLDVDNFFDIDGPTTFVDNVALLLGINPASIRVVAITKGSTVVDFGVSTNQQSSSTDPIIVAQVNQEVNDLMAKLNAAAAGGKLNFKNAVVLDYSFQASIKNYDPASPSVKFAPAVGYLLIIVAVAVAVLAIAAGGFIMYKRHQRQSIFAKLPKTVQPQSDKHDESPEHISEINSGERVELNGTDNLSKEAKSTSMILEH